MLEKKPLQLSPGQLHGLTFYVDDRADGRVRLDGADIADLVRNPADETGRESVTVVGADIRHVLLDEADVAPAANGIAWRWVDDAKRASRGQRYAELTPWYLYSGQSPLRNGIDVAGLVAMVVIAVALIGVSVPLYDRRDVPG